MISRAIEENLGFILQAPKRARMDDSIPVTLVLRPPVRRRFSVLSPARVPAELRISSQVLPFKLLQFLACARHQRQNRNPNLGGQNQIEVTAKNAKISNREICEIRESSEGKTITEKLKPFCAQFKKDEAKAEIRQEIRKMAPGEHCFGSMILSSISLKQR